MSKKKHRKLGSVTALPVASKPVEKSIEQCSVEELKCFAYDAMVACQRASNEVRSLTAFIQAIDAELAKRGGTSKTTVQEVAGGHSEADPA